MANFFIKHKKLFTGSIILASITFLFVSITSGGYYDFLQFVNGNINGEVGLRNYYETGTGTASDPYIIARPNQFYNLTRLQNLGIYTDPTTAHFKLGYDLDGDTATADNFINPYFDSTIAVSETNPKYLDYLDMSQYTSNINSIGSEGAPFYGTFDGNYKIVKNLTVHSSPEDIGVFGYVTSGAIVKNVIFSSLNIYSDGYTTTDLSDLYGAGLTASIDVYNDTTKYTDDMKSGVKFLNASLANLTFRQNITTNDEDITYTLKSVNNAITIDSTTGYGSVNLAEGSVLLNSAFAGSNNKEIDSRVYLVANKRGADKLVHSRVVCSYKLAFVNKLVDSVSKPEVTIYLDYVDSTNTAYTQYSHGQNIGFLVGHVDGSISHCYVYNGTMHLNGTDTATYTYGKHESEYGLIGEVGINIDNNLSPSTNYENSGDTGVINFTKIFDSTRADVTTTGQYYNTDTVGGGGHTYYTYTPIDTSLYLSYLRTNAGRRNYITENSRAIDFEGQQYIADSAEKDLGLGIFSLYSSNYLTKPDSVHDTAWLNGIGKTAITKDENTYSSLYYTTAEYNKTAANSTTITEWTDNTYDDIWVPSAYTIPNISSSALPYFWNSYSELYTNYTFKVDLADDTTMGNSNYFYNTDSEFLQSYLKYKLVNKSGASIEPGDSQFGLYVKDVTDDVVSNITSFDSYLNIGSLDSNKFDLFDADINGTSTKVPARSIGFNITTSDEANVTIIASNGYNSTSYVGVYKRDSIISNDTAVTGIGNTPDYAMILPQGQYDNKTLFAFDYNSSTGVTADVVTPAASTYTRNKLYAHTFRLPKGQYYIGSPNNGIKIYYIAAQGQEKANAGIGEKVYIGTDSIGTFDFLLYDPEDLSLATLADDATRNSTLNTSAAHIYSDLLFNNVLASTFTVSTNADTHKLSFDIDDNLDYALIYNVFSIDYYFESTTAQSDKYYVYNKA